MGDIDGWKAFQAAVAILTAVFGWVWHHTLSRTEDAQDDHQQRLEKLERTYVTREELEKAFQSMRADRYQMHKENREALKALGVKVDETGRIVGQVSRDVGELSGRYRGLRP